MLGGIDQYKKICDIFEYYLALNDPLPKILFNYSYFIYISKRNHNNNFLFIIDPFKIKI